MEVNRIDAAINAHVPVALRDFRKLCAFVQESQGYERLVLLNALVLTGPAFAALEEKLAPRTVPESIEVRHEIAVLQSIPEAFLEVSVRGFADLEIEKLVSPQVEIRPTPAEKVSVFLQASTDTRRIAFGRLIGFLSRAPTFSEEWLITSGAQRSVAFAAHVMAERNIECAAWHPISGQCRDAIAKLILLHALRIGTSKHLVSRETSEAILNSISRDD